MTSGFDLSAAALDALAAAAGLGAAAIELRSLDSSECWSREPGAPLYPASMIKLPLAVAVAAAVDAGRDDWQALVEVDDANMTPNDAPSPLVPGAVATLAELVDLMISRSDNVATNLLIDRLGRAAASADVAALGFPATVIRRKLSGALPLIADPAATGRNEHPARDAAGLFERIAAGTVPGAARLAGGLARQYWNTKLSAGLLPGDTFAHKTGDTDDVSHDGGILQLASGERYVLVVYTGLASNEMTDRRFAAFMRELRPRLRRGNARVTQ